MSSPFRIAILGLGHWYSAYGLARALPEYPRAELVAVASPDRERREAFTGTFGGAGYDDYEAVLNHPDVDVVHVATPVSEIPELTVRAAEAGKHIVLGKPMAMTLAEADRMVEAVERAGVVCVPFQSLMRFRYAGLKERVGRGAVGDLLVLHATARWSIAEDAYRSGRPGWFVDPRHVPGGALIDEGIYWIDLFSWLSDRRIERVEARTANLLHRELEVEDWGMATFTLEGGLIATLEASWTINAPRVTGPSPKQNSVVRLEVVGSRGEIMDQWFREPGRAVLAAGADDWVFERSASELMSPGVPMPLDHLLDCIEEKCPPAATIREARHAFAAALAAYESARQGRPAAVE